MPDTPIYRAHAALPTRRRRLPSIAGLTAVAALLIVVAAQLGGGISRSESPPDATPSTAPVSEQSRDRPTDAVIPGAGSSRPAPAETGTSPERQPLRARLVSRNGRVIALPPASQASAER